MIVGARRIKDLIRNQAQGDYNKAQMLLRHFAMERLLERLSLSKYANNFVIKGGILVSSIIGIEERMTRDIDATMRGQELTKSNIRAIFEEISDIEIGDGFTFEFGESQEIMEDSVYGGIRISVQAFIEKTKTNFKIDISTGDAITPCDIEQSYKLMFEDRSIALRSYNIETVLAEKLETILSLSVQTTRMRDFYDVYMLVNAVASVDYSLLRKALESTMAVRQSQFSIEESNEIILLLQNSEVMPELWKRYVDSNKFAKDVNWEDVLHALKGVISKTQNL